MEVRARKNTAAAIAATLALVGAMTISAIPAFAAGTNAESDLYIAGGDTQLSVTVPTEMRYVANADGSLACPTNAQISNGSVMGIHVSKISVAAEGGATLSRVSAVDAADEIGVAITPTIEGGAAGTAIELADYTTAAAPAVAANWNLARTGQNGDAITFAQTGKIGAFGVLDPAQSLQFAQITWTFAPGSAS